MPSSSYDLAIIGGGVLGAFHAYHALQAGLRVALFEKNKRPQGATVRNFGQVVPSGLNAEWQPLGRESLRIYQRLHQEVDLTMRAGGSMYLASDEEEQQLLHELAARNRQAGYMSELWSAEQCRTHYPGLRQKYVREGLFFPAEISLDPRQMVHRLLAFMTEKYGLHYFPGHAVAGLSETSYGVKIDTLCGSRHDAGQVVVCNGSEFALLFPGLFRASDIQVVKLHMLETGPQPRQRIPGNILTGLTIRRYESFQECPSWAAVKARETPHSFGREYGVHILFKQADDGAVIIGDSHEYAPVADADNLGFDLDNRINRYMMEKAMAIFELENWTIRRAWYGIYSQRAEAAIYRHSPQEHIHIVTAIGGKGMTVSPAFAKKSLQDLGIVASPV